MNTSHDWQNLPAGQRSIVILELRKARAQWAAAFQVLPKEVGEPNSNPEDAVAAAAIGKACRDAVLALLAFDAALRELDAPAG